jgi:hypothetical protein
MLVTIHAGSVECCLDERLAAGAMILELLKIDGGCSVYTACCCPCSECSGLRRGLLGRSSIQSAERFGDIPCVELVDCRGNRVCRVPLELQFQVLLVMHEAHKYAGCPTLAWLRS